MGNPQIAYTLRPDGTSETNPNILVGIYRRAIERYEDKHNAAEPAPELNGRDVVKESNEHDATTGSIPRSS